MRAEIAKLQHELGTTTIYVTHDQVEAMTMGDRVAVMNRGLLQQVDAPQRLFDEPANLFVAAFIGTPPMNLLQGRVSAQNGTVAVALGAEEVPLTERTLAAYPRLRRYGGRQVVVGIRPGVLHPANERPDLPSLSARVELVEALGSESTAYFHVDAAAVQADAGTVESNGSGRTAVVGRPNLVASFPPHLALRLGDVLPVAVDPAQLHFFDAESGAPLR
jgi:multiple sugar transport system ATP-binding protein